MAEGEGVGRVRGRRRGSSRRRGGGGPRRVVAAAVAGIQCTGPAVTILSSYVVHYAVCVAEGSRC